MSHLNLTFLPPEIESLTALRHLNLEGNKLTKLPDFILKLKNLEKLNFKNNHLTETPDLFNEKSCASKGTALL